MNGMTPEPGDPSVKSGGAQKHVSPPAWVIYLEEAVNILCILLLWPFILGWTEPVWWWLMCGGVVVLLLILARRWRRAKAALEAVKQEGREGPQLPFVPPGRRL